LTAHCEARLYKIDGCAKYRKRLIADL